MGGQWALVGSLAQQLRSPTHAHASSARCARQLRALRSAGLPRESHEATLVAGAWLLRARPLGPALFSARQKAPVSHRGEALRMTSVVLCAGVVHVARGAWRSSEAHRTCWRDPVRCSKLGVRCLFALIGWGLCSGWCFFGMPRGRCCHRARGPSSQHVHLSCRGAPPKVSVRGRFKAQRGRAPYMVSLGGGGVRAPPHLLSSFVLELFGAVRQRSL